MKTPNFLVIGAMKAGTTALYYYLRQHPQIYMSPVKETSFFATEGKRLDFCGPGDEWWLHNAVTDLQAYFALFQGVTHERAIGEASPIYLYIPESSERIRHYLPETKLIAILRDPVERAYSNFLHLVRDGREPFTDFVQALQAEESRIHRNWGWGWHYLRKGFYYAQVKRYYDLFDQNQIRIYLYEDFNTSPASTLQDIFDFLDVDRNFVQPNISIRANVSAIPRNKALHNFLGRPYLIKNILKPFLPARFRRHTASFIKKRNISKPKLPVEIRRQLIQSYREDILKLQDLIQHDLSKWLE
jgi:hypothetical protein